jgi:hypothetical protein
MYILKIVLTLFCVWPLVDFIVAVYTILSPHDGSHSTSHENLVMAGSLVAALFYAAAVYGIHKRTFIVWKLGWGFLAIQYLGWLFQGLSLTLKIPHADKPWVASAAIVIGGALVVFYWGFWWNRQKSYFMKPASHG